jgi:hypothetical protein
MPLGDSRGSRKISLVKTLIPLCMCIFRDLRDRSRDARATEASIEHAARISSAMVLPTNAYTVKRQLWKQKNLNGKNAHTVMHVWFQKSPDRSSDTRRMSMSPRRALRIPSAMLSFTNAAATGRQQKNLTPGRVVMIIHSFILAPKTTQTVRETLVRIQTSH